MWAMYTPTPGGNPRVGFTFGFVCWWPPRGDWLSSCWFGVDSTGPESTAGWSGALCL